MKKILLGIAVFITTAIICIVSVGAEVYGDYEYAVLDDSTVEITCYYGTDAELSIPSEIEGKKVTSIGDFAFQWCNGIKTVIIPDGVTSIEKTAFYMCESLKTINIPDSITRIEDGAFNRCSSLISVTLPDGVTNIANETFLYCSSLTSVNIPNGVINIGNNAFNDCALTSVFIPGSVASIGDSAFSFCTDLASITIENGVTSIGKDAFYMCESLEAIVIPNSVTSIGNGAFNRCSSLTSITIPEGVATIGAYTFSYCGSSICVTFPESVTTIDDYAFYGNDDPFINCYKDSVAHQYALEKNISYRQIVTPSDMKGFKASANTTKALTLNWTKNDTALGYIIEQYKDDEWVQIAQIDNPATTTYNVTGLVAGTAYKFRMKACNEYGTLVLCSNYTSTLSACTKPTNIAGFKLGGRASDALRLSWTKNTSADGYIIEQYNGSKWVRIAKITDPATTTYRVTGLAAGTAYKFRMRAYIMDGAKALYSGYTSTLAARTNPSNITGYKLGGRGADALRLNWTKNTSADGYIVEQYKSGKWVRIAKITSNATTTYKISGLKASTQYKFRVKAYKMSGKTALYSGYTSTLSAYTNPSKVANLKITGKATTALRLGWSKNTSADGYIIEMYKDGKWVRAAKITSNATVTFRKSGLKKGTTYKFRVRTYNMVGKTVLYGNYVNVSGTTNK